MKTVIPFVIPSLRIKCLGIHLMKEVKNLYYKKLMKRIEGDQINWKIVCIHGLEGWLSLKCAIIPKAIYRFKALPIKIPVAFFTDIEKTILDFVWNCKRPQVAKAILRKDKKARGIMPPDFKVYYKATVIKMVRQWHKTDIPINGAGQTARPSPHIWSTDLWQRSLDHRVGPGRSLQQMVLGQLDCHVQKNGTGQLSTPDAVFNSHWIQELNVRPKTITLLEENIGSDSLMLVLMMNF